MSHAPTAAVSLSRRLSRSLESTLSALVAWAFALATAGLLLHLARSLYSGQLPAASPLIYAPHAPAHAEPWGLAYLGIRGAYCAAGQAAAVLFALGMSMMLSGAARRLGLLALVAWSGLWATDAILLIAESWRDAWWHTTPHMLAATLALLIILAANLHRATRLWRIRVKV